MISCTGSSCAMPEPRAARFLTLVEAKREPDLTTSSGTGVSSPWHYLTGITRRMDKLYRIRVRSILSFNGRSVFGADCRSRLQTLWGRISSGIFLNGIGLSLARVSHGGSLVNLNSLKQVLKLQIDGIDRLAGKANNSED